MMLLALLIQAAAPPIPLAAPADKVALGRQLAATGTLATLLPMLVAQDLAALTSEAPALADADKARVLAIGRRIADERRRQLIEAFAIGYAQRLSRADLLTLVAAAESPAAARKRAADVPVTMGAMMALGGVDLKKETAAAACAEAQLLCARK